MTCIMNTFESIIPSQRNVSKKSTTFLSLVMFKYKGRLVVHAVALFFSQRIRLAECLLTDLMSYLGIVSLDIKFTLIRN